MNSNNDNGKKSFGEKIKEIWKKIPLGLKLKIIVIGGVGIILISIIALISLTPLNFLFYSDDIQNENSEVSDAYDEYWNDLCEEDSEICKEDQKEAAKKLKEDQKAFYDRLDSLSNEYLSNNEEEKKEQRYLVLTTVFYGYDINEIIEGENSAFQLDDPDNNEMTVSEDTNIYKQEKDTLKELVKQFKVTTAVCARDFVDENNNLTEVSDELKDSEGNSFYFNFFEKVQFNMGLYSNEEYEKARKECLEHYSPSVNPRVKIKEIKEGKASTDAFYNYLISSEYLDNLSQHKNVYQQYANSNGLSSEPKDWPEADRKAVRQQIADEIKKIVEAGLTPKKEQNSSFAYEGENVAYWWPIGSKETTTINGKLFATGDPQFLHVTSSFGPRWGANHGGVDLQAWDGDYNDTANIIASRSGKVERVVNSCAPFTPNGSCGYGWGNHVLITDDDGNQQNYAHLSKVYVQVGEKVEQGQVLGKAGNSGDSQAVHLHFEMWVNGQRVDPLHSDDPNDKYEGYIYLSKPRPTKRRYDYYKNPTPSNMYMLWLIAKEGCMAGWTDDHKYYYVYDGRFGRGDGKRTLGHGLTIEATDGRFLNYGINISSLGDMDKVRVDIADKVKLDIVMDEISLIVNESTAQGIKLNQYQIEGLASFLFNLGDGVLPDFWPAYKEYKDNLPALFDNFFLLYVHSNNDAKYMQGLINRRKSEWEIFYKGNYNIDHLKNPSENTLNDYCLERDFVEKAWEEKEEE